MSVETRAAMSIEEKVRRKITWYRVPLMAIAFVLVMGFVHQKMYFWYGVPVVIFGELIQMWATSHLHKDKHMTISGPYSHVRNPMYFGRFFVGLGFFIMTDVINRPYLIIGYVILFAAYAHMRVRREEARLQELFKPDYQHFCSEVNRWLPKPKPYSKSESRRASWTQMCDNHEQIVALGVLIVLAVVYLRIDKIAWHWMF